jgi:hypothetical protein
MVKEFKQSANVFLDGKGMKFFKKRYALGPRLYKANANTLLGVSSPRVPFFGRI